MVSKKRGKEYVRDHIINSRMHAPDSIMPSFKEYNDAELDSLVMYLSSFTYKLDLEQVEELLVKKKLIYICVYIITFDLFF